MCAADLTAPLAFLGGLMAILYAVVHAHTGRHA